MATRVGVAAEIGEHGLGSGEGALGVDDPFDLAQGSEMAGEGGRVGEVAEIVEEAQAAGPVGGDELLRDQAAEQAREHADRQEESRPAGDPMLTVWRDAAAGNDAVHMRMVGSAPIPRCAAPGSGRYGRRGAGDRRRW